MITTSDKQFRQVKLNWIMDYKEDKSYKCVYCPLNRHGRWCSVLEELKYFEDRSTCTSADILKQLLENI